MYSAFEIALNIKMILASRQVTTIQMINDLGCGKNLLVHMSRGHMPSVEVVAEIADYLDVSIDFLLGRTGNMNSHKS